MSNTPIDKSSTTQSTTSTKTRKPYHTPQLETYGTVSALTRSGTLLPITIDGVGTYTSFG